MIEVVATKLGYYDNGLKPPGTVFNVPEGETATWFEPTQPPPPEEPLL